MTSPQSIMPRAEVPLNLYRVSSPGTARVVSNDRLTPPGHDDVRHIVLDLSEIDYRYVEGQSLGVLPPGLDDRGKPHKLRLYSIASACRGDDGQGRSASLCVKRLVYNDPVTGQERRGVASNYLCDLQPGDPVAVAGPSGKTFLMPDDPAANLILIATGTGIAPFRAFLRRIAQDRPAWTGAIWLIFGVRAEAECLYRAELETVPGVRLAYAFSREQQRPDGGRMYVQHRLAEHLDDLWPLIGQDQTHLYVCGLKGMEDGIVAALEARAHAEGLSWPTLQETLKKRGRFLIETY